MLQSLFHEFGVYSVHISSAFISVILIFLMLDKTIKKVWIVTSMAVPPIISATILAILAARFAEMEEKSSFLIVTFQGSFY